MSTLSSDGEYLLKIYRDGEADGIQRVLDNLALQVQMRNELSADEALANLLGYYQNQLQRAAKGA